MSDAVLSDVPHWIEWAETAYPGDVSQSDLRYVAELMRLQSVENKRLREVYEAAHAVIYKDIGESGVVAASISAEYGRLCDAVNAVSEGQTPDNQDTQF